MLVEAPPPAPVIPAAPSAVSRRRLARRLGAAAVPYLYLTPALAGFGLWIYRPLVQTFQYSFLRWNLLPQAPRVGVGLENYRQLLRLPALRSALGATGIYMAGMIVLGVVLPLGIGLATQGLGGRARAIYRGVLFVPVLVSPIVAATIFDLLLAPDGGLVNTVVHWFGAAPVNWLVAPSASRLSIVMISGWKVLGVSVLIVAAGLATINGELYEAAAIDGATRGRTLRELTLPLLSPTLLFLVVVSVLLSSQIIFPLLNTLTQGQSGTSDIYYLLYTYGFTSFNVGLASAAAVLFFLAFALVAVGCVALMDRWGFYDS